MTTARDHDLRQLFARLASAAPAAPGAPAPGEVPERTPAQERLVKAALEVFAEDGYAAATTRAIAARAGVAEKTLFQAFGSKAGLFNAAVYPLLLATLGPAVFTGLREAIQRSAAADVHSRLRAIAGERLQTVAREPTLFRFLLQELLLRPGFRAPFIERWKTLIYPLIRGAIAAAAERGELRAVPPGRVLRIFISVVVGYLVTRHVLLPELDWDDDAELDGMLDVLLNGLAVPR